MMTKTNLFWLVMLLACRLLPAQTFVHSGVIEYEHKVAMARLVKEEWPDWYQQAKDNIPKFVITYNNLYFNDSQSLFAEGREPDTRVRSWWSNDRFINTISNNFSTGLCVQSRQVYDETFLLTDSIRPIRWRISNDTRNIAGYECRKAVGRIFDSVYIIAFYTDKLICPGGPEQFTGLPGTILGAAIPRLHTTWFATRVDVVSVTQAQLQPPAKGKKIQYQKMVEKLTDTFKDWGKTMLIRSLI